MFSTTETHTPLGSYQSVEVRKEKVYKKKRNILYIYVTIGKVTVYKKRKYIKEKK